MITPLISVLMTAYNREQFIAEAIESVIASTFTDFELIIVDDCSQDNTVAIAKKYESLDSRIKVYVNEKNLGDYPNRNKAASYAIGKYLKYLDSDDILYPGSLKIFVELMEKNPTCAIGVSAKIFSDTRIHNPISSYRTHFFKYSLLDFGPSHVIINRTCFEEEGGFIEFKHIGDYDLWLRLALKYNILEISNALIEYQQHEAQEMKKDSHVVFNLYYNITIVNSYLTQSKITNLEKLWLLRKFRKETFKSIIKNFFLLGIFQSLQIIRINKLSLFDLFGPNLRR